MIGLYQYSNVTEKERRENGILVPDAITLYASMETRELEREGRKVEGKREREDRKERRCRTAGEKEIRASIGIRD